jgi:hypothetical protein
MRLRYFIGACFAVLVVVTACDLNPQPIPPGEQSDGGFSDNPGTGGGSNTSSGSGDGSTPAAPSTDGGTFLGSGDAASDAAFDGSSDGSTDAEPGDAGDASTD